MLCDVSWLHCWLGYKYTDSALGHQCEESNSPDMQTTAVLGVLLLLSTSVLRTVTGTDELEPILGRPWQPLSPRQKGVLQAKFMQNLNEMMSDCYREQKSEICRQKMFDVPLDIVYRVHPHRWWTVGRREGFNEKKRIWRVFTERRRRRRTTKRRRKEDEEVCNIEIESYGGTCKTPDIEKVFRSREGEEEVNVNPRYEQPQSNINHYLKENTGL